MATLREYLVESPIRHHNLTYLDEHGNYQTYSQLTGKADADFEPVHLEVPHTAWGDYDGSSLVERANYVWFEEFLERHEPGSRYESEDSETYRDLVSIDRTYSLSGGRVLMALDVEIPEDLQDLLEGLADYPIIEDETLCVVEEELFGEDWESWLEHDLRSEVEKAMIPADSYSADWDVAEMIGDGARLRELYHQANEEFWDYQAWAAETSTSGYIQAAYRGGKHVDGMTTLAGDIADLIVREFTAASAPIDGQGVLEMAS